MHPELYIIEYRNRERALETAAAHRRAREARPASAPRAHRRLSRRLAHALRLR